MTDKTIKKVQIIALVLGVVALIVMILEVFLFFGVPNSLLIPLIMVAIFITGSFGIVAVLMYREHQPIRLSLTTFLIWIAIVVIGGLHLI